MYVRKVRESYQLPLANVLIYCWFRLFDSEFAIRFDGFLTMTYIMNILDPIIAWGTSTGNHDAGVKENDKVE